MPTGFRDWLKKHGRGALAFLPALLLSFGIWLINNYSQFYSEIVTIPVIAKSNIAGHSEYSITPATVVARCRTTGYNLMHLYRIADKGPVSVFIESRDLHAQGDNQYSISATELGGYVQDIFGEDVQLESFVSQTLQFTFPEEKFKKVPVQLVSLITFKPQYVPVEKIKISPDSVLVYGEPRYLQNIEQVSTYNLTLNELKSSVSGIIALKSPAGVRLSDVEVSYSLEVSRYVEISDTKRIEVRNVPADRELSVFPSTAEVLFRCTFPMGLNPADDISFYIDYEDFIHSINGRCIPKVSELPKSVIDYKIEPQIFECIEKHRD